MITVSTSKSGLPKAYHHGDLRQALIAAALALLEEGSDPASLSLREVARQAGVSAMAPYRHFADKRALLSAVAEVGFGQLGTALQDADRAQDPVDALVGQGVAYVTFACAKPALFRLMFGTALAGNDNHGELGTKAYSVMAERVAGMVEKNKRDDWALRCWATAHGLASLAVDGQLADRSDTATALADRILRLSSSLPG